MAYIDVPIDTDPQDVTQDAYNYLQAVIPGWNPNVGNLDVWIIQSLSTVAAESRDVASRVPTSIFRWFGAYLVGIPPIDAAAASSTALFTAQDTAGYTIPANTIVGIPSTGTDLAAFQTSFDVTIPPGQSSAHISIIAIEEGADGSGLGPVGEALTLISPLTFIISVTLDAVTTGGVDAEADDDYLNRLAADLTLLAPRPILPNDFAIFARNIPGVYRATAIDGYNPAGGGTYNNPRTVAVAAIDQLGNPVSATIKAAIQADLQARREVNFIVNMLDPSVTQIDVTYQVKALVGTDHPTLLGSVNAALSSYLSAATWGANENDAQAWTNNPVVRYLEVAQVINQVSGVDYITTTSSNYDLQIGLHGGSLGRLDITMPGAAALPSAGTLTGTVT